MYFDPFEPIREETTGSARASPEPFEKFKCSDDLLLAENESLRVRVAELEKTVSRQQSELVSVLQSLILLFMLPALPTKP